MKTEKIEADVLCVGGGIAGLMAAIRASELGMSVVISEKGNTARSGEARAGNDHFGLIAAVFTFTNFFSNDFAHDFSLLNDVIENYANQNKIIK